MNGLMLNIGVLFVGIFMGTVLLLTVSKKNNKVDGIKKEKKAEELIGKAKEESKKIKEESISHVEKRKEDIKQNLLKKEQ